MDLSDPAEAVLCQTLDELELSALQGGQLCLAAFQPNHQQRKGIAFQKLRTLSTNAGKAKLVTESPLNTSILERKNRSPMT